MKTIIFLTIIVLSQISFANPAKVYDSANEAVQELSELIQPGSYSGETLSNFPCKIDLHYYSFSGSNVANILVTETSNEIVKQIVITLSTDPKIIYPTSEMASGQRFTLPDNRTEKFRFGLLSGGNKEKYFSIEIGPEGTSIIAREGYILDPNTPRVICLNLKKN